MSRNRYQNYLVSFFNKLVKNWKSPPDMSADHLKFMVLKLIKVRGVKIICGNVKVPMGVPINQVKELDFSNCELTLKDINLSVFASLEKLSLANNQIKMKWILGNAHT